MTKQTVAVTPGSGADVGGDLVTGLGFVEYMKLVGGAEDSDELIPGTAANGLDVDPTRLPAGEIHLGEVGGSMLRVAVEFTRPADTTAYTAGDMVSNSTSATTLMTFTGAGRVSGGTGYIVGVTLTTDKKSITPRFRVHLFSASNPTLAVDNAAWIDKYADISKRMGYFDLPAMSTGADATNSDMSRSQDNTIRHRYVCATTILYACLEALDAWTPASGEKLTLALWFDRN